MGVGWLTLHVLLSASLALGNICRDDGSYCLGRTPQMGWNSWNYFQCDINEDVIYDAARAIVSTGLKAAGYEYVMIDDCWEADERDPVTSAPVAHPDKFSRGMKHLSDRIHDLGLKFGIYSSAGTKTCGRRFGSLGYEDIDAQTYAEWGVDYLKYDNCWAEPYKGTPEISFERYNNMSRALKKTGREIWYAICNWGEDSVWDWAAPIAHSWRISGDITFQFDRPDPACPCESMLNCTAPGNQCPVTQIIDFAAPLGHKAGPGHWNDLDMLEVGNGDMTHDEYVTHFSIWAILKSPLILGNDLTLMSPDILGILTNDALIRINQDAAGVVADRIWKKRVRGGNIQLWAGPLANGDTVVAVVNLSPSSQTVKVPLEDIFPEAKGLRNAFTSYQVTDLWEKDSPESGSWGKDLGTSSGSLVVPLRRHQTQVYRLTPVTANWWWWAKAVVSWTSSFVMPP